MALGGVELVRAVRDGLGPPEPPVGEKAPALHPHFHKRRRATCGRKLWLTRVPWARTLKPYLAHRSFIPWSGRTSMIENCSTTRQLARLGLLEA